MLIEDGKLNIKELKSQVTSIKWTKVPRELGPRHKQFFYVGSYEDEDKIIDISIRPSMWMQVKESFKNRDVVTGKKVTKPKSNQKYVTFGSSTQVRVNESFVEKIKELAQEMEQREIQTISWD